MKCLFIDSLCFSASSKLNYEPVPATLTYSNIQSEKAGALGKDYVTQKVTTTFDFYGTILLAR